MSLGDNLLSLFGITKKRMITVAAAATIVSTSFGFLMRDIVNFGKMEGDKKPAALVRAENKIFGDVLNKINKAKLAEEEILSEDILKEIKALTNNIRDIIVRAEKVRMDAYGLEDRGDIEGALDKLQYISNMFKKIISGLPEANTQQLIIAGDKEVVICPDQAIFLVGDSIKTLKEDIDSDIARLSAVKKNK